VGSSQRQQVLRQQQKGAATQHKEVYVTRRRATMMNWHSPRFRISLLVIFIMLAISGFGIFWYFTHIDPMTQVTHSYLLKDVPTSTASLTTYNDSSYNFVVSYPSDWKVNKFDFNGFETIHFNYQVDTSPDVYPLDINCNANPQNLTAQQWAEQYPDNTSLGTQSLPNGTVAFVSTAHGQGDYTIYTFVTGQKVCTVGAYAANSDNGKLIDQVAKSFQWQQ